MKIHPFLYVLSGVALLNMVIGKPDAEEWLISGAVAFFSFIIACIAKAFYDDKMNGETAMRDAVILWMFWKLFGPKEEEN